MRAKSIIVYGQGRKFSAIDSLGRINELFYNHVVKRIFRSKIKTYNEEVFARTLWSANIQSIEYSSGINPYAENCESYLLLKEMLNQDDSLIKFYQARAVLYMSRMLHFAMLTQDLSEKESVVAICPAPEFKNIDTYIARLGVIKQFAPLRNQVAGRISRFLRNMVYQAEFILLPVLYLPYALLKYRFSSEKKTKSKLLMQMHWGSPDEEDKSFGRTTQNDYYLYGKCFKQGDVLHYYDNAWKFSKEKKQLSNAYMDSHGYPWLEKNERIITSDWVKEVVVLQKNILTGMFIKMGLLKDAPSIVNISAWALVRVLDRSIDVLNFDVKAVFDRQDYNPRHIIDTIFFNKHGVSTIGLHHCASPYDSPQIAYMHYDYYVIFGDMFFEPYRAYWDEKRLIKTGRINIDWVVDVDLDKDKKESSMDYLHHKYGKFDTVVTLILPGDAPYMFRERWKEVEKFLIDFCSTEMPVAILMRFKSKGHVAASNNLKRLMALCEQDNRLIVENEKLTTYDCIALSDLVIAPNTSTAVNEAAAIKKHVFVFDYHERTPLLFSRYGEDFILKNASELMDRVSNAHDISNYKCDWELLYSESNYSCGGNMERLQQHIYNVIS